MAISTPQNIFITRDLRAKIGDMQGQLFSPDGSVIYEAMSGPGPEYMHPHAPEDEFSVRTDTFALGTLLFRLWHGCLPFPDLEDFDWGVEEEVMDRYRRGEFPISAPRAEGIDVIIIKCWTSQYSQVDEALREAMAIQRESEMQSPVQPILLAVLHLTATAWLLAPP